MPTSADPDPDVHRPSSSGSTPRLPSPRIVPGLLVAVAVGVASVALSRAVPAASAALVAILAGAAAANTRLLPTTLQPGLDVAGRTVLRLGIVLLGLQLALGDVIALGPGAVVLILAVVAIGVASGIALGRALRVPPALTLLIASGFSICGAAAVAAVRGVLPVIPREGEDREDAAERLSAQTAMAVALVVVFGTAMIPLVPLLSGALGLDESAAGVWAGASIHEVAQVVAAGGILGPDALRAAVVVKLGRVLLLAPVIAVVAALTRRGASAVAGGGSSPATTRPPLVPLFVVGFLLAVAARSAGVVPGPVLAVAQPVQAVLLAAAMFALGTGVRASLLRSVGPRPVVLAAVLTLGVAAVGLGGALAVG